MGLDRDPEGFKPGGLGCHEALHMAAFLAGAVEEELAEHPAVKRDAEWSALAHGAVTALVDLYQAIGAKHL